MFVSRLTVLASLFASSAAVAQVAAPVTPSAIPVQEKRICRSDVPLGSIMAKRVCHTKSEWAQIHGRDNANAAQALDAAHRAVTASPSSTN